MNRAFSKVWIFVILAVFIAGGILVWQHFGVPKEKVEVPEEEIREEVVQTAFTPDEIPTIINAFLLTMVRYDEFKLLYDSEKKEPSNVLQILWSNFETLGGVPNQMGFNYYSFLTQNNIKGHISGFESVAETPFSNFTFVTTPIDELDNNVLLMQSSVSPQQTSIFSVDENLQVKLLYDSFNKNAFDDENTMLGSIYKVKVLESGLLELYERPYERLSDENRVFIVDVRNGEFTIKYTLLK